MSDSRELNAKWLNMTTAFFVSQEYTAKENVKAFREWLADEGYTWIKNECSNMYAAYYIDIESHTYTEAHSDMLMAPIVGGQGIEYDDFKIIHYVFKNKAEKEKTWRFRPRYLTPIPLYLNYQRIRHEDWEEEKQTYFSKNPSFEQWCDDVFKEIKNHYWYKKHRPDYSKEEFLEDLAYPYIEREMRYYFGKKEMPIEMAGGWDLINM